jgi:ABC-type arginine/histidine transport system permease subunit
LQLIFYSRYSPAATTAITAISYTTAIVMIGLLAYLFFMWFNQNRRSASGLKVFLYGLSSAALVLNTIIGLALIYSLSLTKPVMMGPHAGSVTVLIGTPIDRILNPLYIYFGIYFDVECNSNSFTLILSKAWQGQILVLSQYPFGIFR